MNRYTRRIKRDKSLDNVDTIILTAGVGARVKSYEPRGLLKFKNTTLIEHQIQTISNLIPKSGMITVVGYDANKVIKKIWGKSRIVENQIYEESNSGESLRIALNNSSANAILFFHGDLYFENEVFNGVDFSESFVLVNTSFNEKEVGVNILDKYVSIFSYGLETKWSQIAFLRNKELEILRKLVLKNDFNGKYLLTFELLNEVITLGGKFKSFMVQGNKIKELDSTKDIINENFS